LEIAPFRNAYTRDATSNLRIVDEHTVDFSYREITVGSRFHF